MPDTYNVLPPIKRPTSPQPPPNAKIKQFPQMQPRPPRAPSMIGQAVAGARKAFAGAKSNFFTDKQDPNHWWNRSAALQFFDQVVQKVDANSVAFSHAVTVTVQGGPQADLRRVWYLALAAVFGRYRNRVASVQSSEMQAQWDVTEKRVTVSIGYSCGGWWQGLQQYFGSNISSPVSLFHRGPDQVTIGGSWPAWTTAMSGNILFGASTGAGIGGFIGGFLGSKAAKAGAFAGFLAGAFGGAFAQVAVAPNLVVGGMWSPVFEFNNVRTPEVLVKFLQNYGVGARASLLQELPTQPGATGTQFFPWARVNPASAGGIFGSQLNTNAQLPGLPDDGRVITTGQKLDPRVQNPRPPLDGKSRASLCSLVAAALAEPGYLPVRPPNSQQPLGSPGLYLYQPGQGLDDIALSGAPFSKAVQTAQERFVVPVAAALAAGIGPDGYPLPVNSEPIPNARG